MTTTLQIGSRVTAEAAAGGRVEATVVAIRPAVWGDPATYVIRTVNGSTHAVPAKWLRVVR